MKKLLISLDIAWSILVPLFACVYLIYNECDYGAYIIAVGWIMFLLHGVSISKTFNPHISILPISLSLINTAVLLTFLYLDLIELKGFLIIELVSETASYLCAIFIFVVSNQKINGEPFRKKMGTGMAIMNIILISIIVYPFLAEWMIYIGTKADNTIYWIGAFTTLAIAVIKKMSVLKEVVFKVNRVKPSVTNDSGESKLIQVIFILFIVLWFVGLLLLQNLK